MKRIVRLTEADLNRLVKMVLKEQEFDDEENVDTTYNMLIDNYLTSKFNPHEVLKSKKRPNIVFWVKNNKPFIEFDNSNNKIYILSNIYSEISEKFYMSGHDVSDDDIEKYISIWFAIGSVSQKHGINRDRAFTLVRRFLDSPRMPYVIRKNFEEINSDLPHLMAFDTFATIFFEPHNVVGIKQYSREELESSWFKYKFPDYDEFLKTEFWVKNGEILVMKQKYVYVLEFKFLESLISTFSMNPHVAKNDLSAWFRKKYNIPDYIGIGFVNFKMFGVHGLSYSENENHVEINNL